MKNKKENNIKRISREAADWCVTVSSGQMTDADKARFAEWLMASPAHLREFQTIEALWDDARVFGDDLDTDRRVVALFPGLRRHETGAAAGCAARARHAWWGYAGKIAASLLLLAGIGAAMMAGGAADGLFGPARAVYQTAVGENRLIRLDDGSIIELNTASRVTVRMTDKRRAIALERGEAYFVVAKDAARPFVVATDDAFVRALGTEFNVKAVDQRLAVTVIEGEVMVGDGRYDARPSHEGQGWRTNLIRNQQLVLADAPRHDRRKLPVSNSVNAKKLVAWREKKLIFDAMPLSEVVADFNRYNRTVIEIRDPELAALAISGVFDPRDPVAFAKTVEMFPDVAVIMLGEQRILLERRRG